MKAEGITYWLEPSTMSIKFLFLHLLDACHSDLQHLFCLLFQLQHKPQIIANCRTSQSLRIYNRLILKWAAFHSCKAFVQFLEQMRSRYGTGDLSMDMTSKRKRSRGQNRQFCQVKRGNENGLLNRVPNPLAQWMTPCQFSTKHDEDYKQIMDSVHAQDNKQGELYNLPITQRRLTCNMHVQHFFLLNSSKYDDRFIQCMCCLFFKISAPWPMQIIHRVYLSD